MTQPLGKDTDLDTIRVAGVHTVNATKLPTMPRGAWLWPDTRTGMEWATEHDERL